MAARNRWLYLDADGFFASCEDAADPNLYGCPVGVVARRPYADAPLIAVNTTAKPAGVRAGDPVAKPWDSPDTEWCREDRGLLRGASTLGP